MMFKSMEISLIDMGYDKPKINTPLYVPITKLQEMMKLSKK
jgi:hypothetical protein